MPFSQGERNGKEKKMRLYWHKCQSPIGELTLAANEEGLAGLWIAGQKYLGGKAGIGEWRDDLRIFKDVKAWLQDYFAGLNPDSNAIPLSPAGSDFQKSVWRVLRGVPHGCCITYGTIAKTLGLGSRMAPRAVGCAVGRNPILILIPCHRVIGAHGKPGGYAAGLERKLKLLRLEGADTAALLKIPEPKGQSGHLSIGRQFRAIA